MVLSDSEEIQFEKLFAKKHGFALSHSIMKSVLWDVAVWNMQDIPQIVSNPQSVLHELDKMYREINSTDRNTVVSPIAAELGGTYFPKPIICQNGIPNIITNLGLNNMAALITGDSNLTHTHCVVGDGTAEESPSATTLQNQLAVKEFDIDGVRDPQNTQERYAITFFRSDFDSDVTIREAGITTGPSLPDDILAHHIRFTDKPIGTGQALTIKITASHRNGTQS